jgi:type VI secretion system protein ImpK
MNGIVLNRRREDAAPTYGGSMLLDQFRTFHAELSGVREALALSGRMAGEGQGRPEPSDLALRINRRLHRLLDGQAAAAQRGGGGYAALQYRDAQYLMAALADETLLQGDAWLGREYWMDNLLELSLFGTRVAGERVFQNLDRLLADPMADPDMLALYLAVLSLGFRGRYWRPQDNPHLRRYREALAERLNDARGDVRQREANPAPYLCPAAYTATVSREKAVKLPHLRPYLIGFVVLLTLYTLVAHGVWMERTARIDALTAPVGSPTHGAPASPTVPANPVPVPTGGPR